MAVIRSRIWLLSVGHYRQPGADHEEIDERAALCSAKKGGQDQSQARARQVDHSGGARARSRNGAAVCDPAIDDAPSYRAAEAPIGREVQREVLTGQAAIHPLLLARRPSTSSSRANARRVLVSLRPTIARFAPSAASASAAANPMPLVAPVIRICLSFTAQQSKALATHG